MKTRSRKMSRSAIKSKSRISLVDVLGGPEVSGVLEVLLGIDFDVAAGGVEVDELLAALDHFLEEQD